MGSSSQNRSTQQRLKRKDRASKAKLRKSLGKGVRFWIETQARATSEQIQGILKTTTSMATRSNDKVARRRPEISAPLDVVHNQFDLEYTALQSSNLSFANRKVQLHKHRLSRHPYEALGSHPTTPSEGEFTTQEKYFSTNRHDGQQDGGDSTYRDGGDTTTRGSYPRPSEETSSLFCQASTSIEDMHSDFSDMSSQDISCNWMPTSAEENSEAPYVAHASKCKHHRLLFSLASQQKEVARLRGRVDDLRGENSELRRVVNGVRWETEEYLGGGPQAAPLSGQQALFQVQDLRKRCCWYEKRLPGLRQSFDAGMASLDELPRKKMKPSPRAKPKDSTGTTRRSRPLAVSARKWERAYERK